MSSKYNVLLLCGGGSSEHEVSLRSANFFEEILKTIPEVTTFRVEIQKNGDRLLNGKDKVTLRKDGLIFNYNSEEEIYLHYAIPCIHGAPGENGQIQSLFEMMGLPFYGPSYEPSQMCFNKITTKLWLKEYSIPVTPYLPITNDNEDNVKKVKSFFKQNKEDVFLKATHQGSSVGCFHITNEEDIQKSLTEALKLSPYAIVEPTIKGRELEVATFNHEGKIVATNPGEIICPDGFYTYDEKYSEQSESKVEVEAMLPEEDKNKIREYAIKAFEILKLKDLSRIDFFYTDKGEIYLNEINTFPGHTSISMFPMMLENTGLKYSDYLTTKIKENSRR
ncbi:MAG: D-alanine--D-alanine ligase [Oligoflexia bacterium]|nr:D-alanine--D-alanine ligase [Oligoflexia bacterium]